MLHFSEFSANDIRRGRNQEGLQTLKTLLCLFYIMSKGHIFVNREHTRTCSKVTSAKLELAHNMLGERLESKGLPKVLKRPFLCR